ncbi:conserved unknown protein [Ectocarpus siliculosus]|uniref:inositol-1,3,4-trisphosphate 5/6-kinase n=1 Tax=Ectocarpus siliculosus TaxID=2880 RepID=D8LMJ9_ECTSI|nr:conserved unknown protein [Ectocarpus siliculosus]|eukprot:CBN77609.1 conserved unknown protein [Ectocarpus siliculosus]
MAKKMETMAEVGLSHAEVMMVGPMDGLEFHPLNFSERPEEHRRLDVILHKLSEDIMFRDVQPEGDARLSWIEAYLDRNPKTAILDPIDRVSNCINRVTTLKLLEDAYRRHGAAGGMPRPPRFMVLEDHEPSGPGADGGIVPRNGLAFPVICKPVEACGTRGSHTMVVVLDQAGVSALTPPVVVQECRSHGAKLFKVCVIGDEVRVHERPSLPDLPPGLTGSFAFDSQKPYPALEEVKAASAATRARSGRLQGQPPTAGNGTTPGHNGDPSRSASSAEEVPGQLRQANGERSGKSSKPPLPRPKALRDRGPDIRQASACTPTGAVAPASTTTTWSSASSSRQPSRAKLSPGPAVAPEAAAAAVATLPAERAHPPSLSLEAAKLAARRMRETFGLSLFGFDLIVDRATGETFVIDVNYFPSFKDLADFPQVLRRRLKEVVATAGRKSGAEGLPSKERAD